jgi:hypothetical protein
MPEPGGPGGPLAHPIFRRSVNPIPTGEGRLSPPITTGTPNVFHLPASLMIENKLQPSPFFYIIKITIVFLQFRENNLNHFFGRHKDQNIARCTHSSHVLSFSWFLAKWLKRSKVSILISLVFGNFSGNLGNCSYLFYYLHSFFCAKYWPAFHLILSLVL